jgi:hypothetical protein
VWRARGSKWGRLHVAHQAIGPRGAQERKVVKG